MIHPKYCAPFVKSGCSFGTSCSLRHDIFECSCGLILLNANAIAHLQGQRHRKLLAGEKDPKRRNPKFDEHRAPAARRYPAHSNNNAAPQYPEQDGVAQQFMKCEQCGKQIESSAYDVHVEGHIKRQHQDELRAELDAAADDKEGVKVSERDGVDFGISDLESSVEFTITITSTEAPVWLQSYRMGSSPRGDEHGTNFSARLRGKARVVQKGMTRQVSITLHPSFAGRYEDTLELGFFHLEKRSAFFIVRTIKATVGSREDHELLKPKAPYTGRKFTQFIPPGNVVRSPRPPVWTETQWKRKLPVFDAPRDLIKSVYSSGMSAEMTSAYVKRFLPPVFTENTYGKWFQVLLWLEEERVKLDLDAYSLAGVELQADYPRYNLLVKGLAENRPSVLVGDYIQISHSDSVESTNTRTWHEGRVHQVYEKHVSLHFGDGFSTYKGTKFDVRFVLNRLPYRRMHDVLQNNFNPSRFLFPDASHIQGLQRVTLDKITAINPFDRPLRDDEEQMETVAAILNQKPGSAPFVVFGPPGTGKTVTIVEAMRQLLDRDPDARILACAPSNSAADTIARKLMTMGPLALFRLNALSRKLKDMGPDLQPFALINDNSIFAMPSMADLAKYRVVVSTCLSSCVPASLGLKRGHFSHIFIDEAGQGKEPEVMVAIKSIADAKTNVVLAGDNQQLGPILHCGLANSLGLRTSYLSRIMERDIYDLDKGRGITIVKLVKNFRSHPDILKFSNDQFYNSELQACGNVFLIHSLENYEELPKKGFPLIFHGIVGKDMREAKSPSFFNVDEVTQVKTYCLSLLSNQKHRLKPEHIGVITPYHAQRCKILDLFVKNPKLRDIKVGSVEEFQGQERRIIIMSTVRSNKDFVKSDIRRSLGFVANKRRLNVALTRAQALLIVIGNPIVLSLDPLWRSFLNYVHTRGGWRGKQIDWNPEETVVPDGEYASERKIREENEIEETMSRLRAMIIDKHDEDGLVIDFSDSDDGEEDHAAAFERPIFREAE